MRPAFLIPALIAAIPLVASAPGSAKLSPDDLKLSSIQTLCVPDFSTIFLIPKEKGVILGETVRKVFQRDYASLKIPVRKDRPSGEGVLVVEGKINGWSVSRGIGLSISKGGNSLRASIVLKDGAGKDLGDGHVTAAPWEKFVKKTTEDQLMEIAAVTLCDSLVKAMGEHPVTREWDK